MDEKAGWEALSEDMQKHDIGVKEAIDKITDNAKEVEAAKDETADKAELDKKRAKSLRQSRERDDPWSSLLSS